MQRKESPKCSLHLGWDWTDLGCCAGAICTAERARRAAARVAHEEESQALARTWRNMQRSLCGERGLWADAASSEALHWKLDKTEDPSRRHASLAPDATCRPDAARLLCSQWRTETQRAWGVCGASDNWSSPSVL